jgi:hypothetical protein
VQASHVPLQALSQQTPSTQLLEAQSDPVRHTAPPGQRLAHVAGSPPQSTPVSLPFRIPSLQESVLPQPSDGAPQVAPTSAQVFGVQPQRSGVPPPPQVCGAVQSAFDWQPQSPAAVHWYALAGPHAVPGVFGVYVGTPATHVSTVHSFPSFGRSVSSATVRVPPAPSQTTFLQSPATWVAAAVPEAT